jgi:hypothetical protein
VTRGDPELERDEAARHILRRAPSGLVVPPFTQVRRRAERRSSFGLVAASAGVLIVALVVGNAIGERRANLAQQTTTPSVATPAASASGAAGQPAALSARYAVVSGSMVLTRESDGISVGSISAPQGPFAVSQDGARIAYFPGPGFDELWIADVAHLDRPQRVLSIAPRFSGGVVWSTDSKGVLFSASSRERVPGVEGEPLQSSLEGVHLDENRREPFMSQSNLSIRPLLWVREPKIVAGVTPFGQKGPGGYVAISGGAAKTWSIPDAARADVSVGRPVASSDGRWVAATYRYSTRTLIRVWPSEDLARATELEAPSGEIGSALWRPGSLDLAVDVGGSLEVWDRDGAKRRVADLGGRSLAAFRWDGSAVYAGTMGGSTEVIEIDTGRRAPLPEIPVMGATPSSIFASARLE